MIFLEFKPTEISSIFQYEVTEPYFPNKNPFRLKIIGAC